MAKANKKSKEVEEVVSVEPTYTTEAIKEVTMIEKYQEGKNQSIAIRTYFDTGLWKTWVLNHIICHYLMV